MKKTGGRKEKREGGGKGKQERRKEEAKKEGRKDRQTVSPKKQFTMLISVLSSFK